MAGMPAKSPLTTAGGPPSDPSERPSSHPRPWHRVQRALRGSHGRESRSEGSPAGGGGAAAAGEAEDVQAELRRLRAQVAEIPKLRQEIQRLEGLTSSWVYLVRAGLFATLFHPSLAAKVQRLINEGLAATVGGLEELSSAECISVSLPATPDKAPDVQLCWAGSAPDTMGVSVWQLRVAEGTFQAVLSVQGRKLLRFRAQLTVSFRLEGRLVAALFPRGTVPAEMPASLPTSCALGSPPATVAIDPKRASLLWPTDLHRHCWVLAAFTEFPTFKVPVQSRVKAVHVELPLQDAVRAAVQQAVGRELRRRAVAPASVILPLEIQTLDR